MACPSSHPSHSGSRSRVGPLDRAVVPDRHSRSEHRQRIGHPVHGRALNPGCRIAARGVGARHQGAVKAVLGRFLESLLAIRNRPELAGKTDFPEYDQFPRQRLIAETGYHRQQHGNSAAVSQTRTPPTTLTNTSWSPVSSPPWRCSTASSMESRFCSMPSVTRRGVPSWLWSTSAWTSTSSGRVPSQVTITTLPGTASGGVTGRWRTGCAPPAIPPPSSRTRRFH